MAVIMKNKHGFLTGTIPMPSPEDPTFPAWERCNSLVLSWLFYSFSPSITQSVIYFSTASTVWEDLRERFSQIDLLRIAELQEEVYGLKQGNQSVTDFFTFLKTLWEELENARPLPPCSCPAKKHRNQDFVIHFLKGLDERYAVVGSQVLMLDPLPPITRVFAMVIQQERNLQIASGILDDQRLLTAAVNTRRPAPGRGRGGYSQGRGVGSNKQCTFFDRVGHTVDVCYGKHGYPPSHPRYPGHPRLPDRAASPSSSAAMTVTSFSHSHAQLQGNRAVMGSTPEPLLGLTPQQHNTLMAYLKQAEAHVPETKDDKGSSSSQSGLLPSPRTHILCSAKTFSILNKDFSKTFSDTWIIDSGASDHILIYPFLSHTQK
ncbi:uncharacterized protein LOC107616486 [Arachis ipaensis]|uniref:uncharacterized protein LOC107616486 n=1 Tax=Arachis ipaensis TaxID=130454 RepID=UPI0007AF226C|nr:uncharacterized protein LOC107616486 [Arachis ipaensis]